MKTSLLSVVVSALMLSALVAQELRTITAASGPLTLSENAIVQIVGVAVDTNASDSGSTSRPSIRYTYADGTIITNQLGETNLTGGGSGVFTSTSSNPIGNVYTGLTKIEIVMVEGYQRKASVTVKIMTQASEVVSTPMVLPPVDDSNYVIALETSVDMNNWVPSYPGEYLGNGNHRFFRVKATKKPLATP